MENQDSPVSCLNLPTQALEHIGLESELTWMVQESCGMPILSGLKPSSQTDQLFGAFEVSSVKTSCHQQPQLIPPKNDSMPAFAAAALCHEEFRLVDAAEKTSCYINSASSAAEFKTSICQDTFSIPTNGPCNGDFAQNLTHVHLLDGIELQVSEACHKRFILFDQTGSRGKIIFNPALVYEFSNLLPNSANVMEDINTHNVALEKGTTSKAPGGCNAIDCDSRLLAYRESMASAFAALQKVRTCGLGSMTLGDLGNSFVAYSVGGGHGSRLSCNGSSQVNVRGSQSQLHEDTKDLEALLGSDDEEEVSTGHTPCDVTGNNDPTSIQDSTEINTSFPPMGISCEKQGWREEEVDFIPSATEKNYASSNLCSSPTATWESEIQPECYETVMDCDNSDKQFCGSSTISSTREVSSKSRATKHGQPCLSLLKRPRYSKKSRKAKMKKTVELLRSIIPGGGCMDTAAILDMAIQYLKSLQVKVKKLEFNENDKVK